jgi:hypothetical protein
LILWGLKSEWEKPSNSKTFQLAPASTLIDLALFSTGESVRGTFSPSKL